MGMYRAMLNYIQNRELPGRPRLAAQMKKIKPLDVSLREEKISGGLHERVYDVKWGGEDVGTYRVEKKGGWLSELFMKDSTEVQRVLFANLDGKGYQNDSTYGNRFGDVRRQYFECKLMNPSHIAIPVR